jgi:hypothetical protein
MAKFNEATFESLRTEEEKNDQQATYLDHLNESRVAL